MPSDIAVTKDKLPSGNTSLPIYLSKQYRDSLGRLLDLSDDEKERIVRRLKKEVRSWKSDTGSLMNRLEDWNNLAENVIEDSDFPWPGAANVSIPIIPIYLKVYHSVERRSILGADSIWYIETDDQDLMDFVPEIENAINYKARSVWNITEALSEVFWATNRDGLSAMHVPYVEEYEPGVKDVLYIVSIEHFLKEFPSPQDAGLSNEDFLSFYQEAMTATEDDPLEIPIEYDKCVYRGPKGEVVERADFVTFPATAKSIEHGEARGYGKIFSLRKGAVRKKKQEGFWYKDACTDFLKWSKNPTETNSLTQSKDWIEGLSRGDTSDDHKFYELVYWMSLKKNGPVRKYLFTFHYESDLLMAALEYPYRVDDYAIFRIEKRPNRMGGPSVTEQIRDFSDIISTEFNQRINSRTISHVPSFKMAMSLKDQLDLNAEENRFRPGVVHYLPDNSFDKFEQHKIQPVDMGESSAEQQNVFSLCDLLLGSASSLMSGSPQPGDKQAPGNKTGMMIAQSNMRMDDPLAELRSGVEKVGEICLSHEYQFGTPMIKYVVDLGQGKKEIRYLSKSILRKGIKMRMAGITVMNNPEAEFQKYFQLYQAVMAEPTIAQDARRRTELLRLAFRFGRIPNRDKILPSIEVVEQQQQEQVKQALMQMQQEKQAQAQKAQQEKAKALMQGAQDQIRRKQVARKLAESNLGPTPINSTEATNAR